MRLDFSMVAWRCVRVALTNWRKMRVSRQDVSAVRSNLQGIDQLCDDCDRLMYRCVGARCGRVGGLLRCLCCSYDDIRDLAQTRSNIITTVSLLQKIQVGEHCC